MKFVSITLNNFMRYKGENELLFSCDAEKNVTVVLGNNTFGKTTLAQAFRWGLFGRDELNTTNYVKKKDIVLLNNEVIADMGPTTKQSVSVEIVVEEGSTQWKFTRTAYFRRKYASTADLSIIPDGDPKLTMIVYEDGVPGPVINDNGVNPGQGGKQYKEGCVQDAINNMLPRKLSTYFFFDGERWNDNKTKRSEIKDSIDTILGVTGLLEVKRHIKDGPGPTVLKTLRGKIKGSGDEYERIQGEIHALDERIEKNEANIVKEEDTAARTARERDRLFHELNDKRKDEDERKKYEDLQRDIVQFTTSRDGYYRDFVMTFSASAARFFAAGCLPEISSILERVDLEGKNIPGVTTDTVDFLISQGHCLCGEPLEEGSRAYQELMSLRKVIPPEVIGGAAGAFQAQLDGWAEDTRTLLDSLTNKAAEFDSVDDLIAEKQLELEALERKMDRQANVKALRSQYNTMAALYTTTQKKVSDLKARVDVDKEARDGKIKTLDVLAQQDEANRAVNRAIAYAEAIYELADRQAQRKQEGVFEELNAIIAENFEKMFNDGEKYAKLEDDYRVHVYYHSVGDTKDYEETNLSNGEATAINFVYIVSVLELARRRAQKEQEEDGGGGIINLPLVLDGPFSSLSNENTNLIARKLPEFAEQVIIFMLDKDWEASGLDAYTLPKYCYRVNKEEKSNSSSLEPGGNW